MSSEAEAKPEIVSACEGWAQTIARLETSISETGNRLGTYIALVQEAKAQPEPVFELISQLEGEIPLLQARLEADMNELSGAQEVFAAVCTPALDAHRGEVAKPG